MSGRIPSLKVKRIYEPPDPADGTRVLVDRLWPRGVSKERARLDLWLKELAPSPALRGWFGHDPAKWDTFKARYEAELNARPEAVRQLSALARRGPVTLLFAARDPAHNSALLLKAYLERSH
jgi:uncharacterized protein YeaO (DUF488 family)